MRWATSVRRLLGRDEVRLTLRLAGATAAFTSFLLCGLLAYALLEELEEQRSILDDAVATIETMAPAGLGVPIPVHRGVVYRLSDPARGTVAAEWPADAVFHRAASLRTALTASAGDYLMREQRTADGRTLSAALSLRHFARERRELAARAAIVVAFGLLGSLALGLVQARRALAPLRAAFERLAGFSADVAHELRTRVNRVLNGAEIALGTTDDPAVKDDALATIRETAEEMRRTIEQLLLLAKGEEGRLPLVPERIDLGTLLDELTAFYAPEAERLGKTITVAPTAVALSADRDLVERALANLLDNALHHSGAGASIQVAARAHGDLVTITVEDSGPGIAAADATRIFERFVRLDPARAAGAVGLGLPIARMIARVHGGDLDVAPSSRGGAAFRLVLGRVRPG